MKNVDDARIDLSRLIRAAATTDGIDKSLQIDSYNFPPKSTLNLVGPVRACSILLATFFDIFRKFFTDMETIWDIRIHENSRTAAFLICKRHSFSGKNGRNSKNPEFDTSSCVINEMQWPTLAK